MIQTQSPTSAGAAKSPTGQQGDIYQQDGDFIKDIEVNDLRNRYTLTKGSTQKMVNLTRLFSSPLILPERASTLPHPLPTILQSRMVC
jgi:hypothetical protein